MRLSSVAAVLVLGGLGLLYWALTMSITWGEGHVIQPIAIGGFVGMCILMTIAWRTRSKEAEAPRKTAKGTVIGGLAYGTVASICIAAAVQGLFISDDPTLLDAIGIGLFVNLIPPWIGSLAAAGAGAFLYWRAQRVGSFGRLVLEMGGLGAVAALAVTEGLLPIAWQLPRLRIGVFSILAGGGLSMLGTWLLKPLYWGRKRAPSPASQSNHA